MFPESGFKSMNNILTTKKIATQDKLSGMVKTASDRLAKYTDTAVNFVLERAGIKVEHDDSNCRDEIRKNMIVVAACGRRVGYVDEVFGDYIKLTCFQGPSLIPMHWVNRVDSLIFLERDYEEVTRIRSLV